MLTKRGSLRPLQDGGFISTDPPFYLTSLRISGGGTCFQQNHPRDARPLNALVMCEHTRLRGDNSYRARDAAPIQYETCGKFPEYAHPERPAKPEFHRWIRK